MTLPPLSPTNHLLLLLPFISVGQGCSSFFPGITTPISFSFSIRRRSQPLRSPPADVFFAAVHRVMFLFLNCPVLAMWSRRFYSRQRSTLVLGIALCGEAFQKKKEKKNNNQMMRLDVWETTADVCVKCFAVPKACLAPLPLWFSLCLESDPEGSRSQWDSLHWLLHRLDQAVAHSSSRCERWQAPEVIHHPQAQGSWGTA